MAMKDMSMSKAETEKSMSIMTPKDDKPKYPYGLCLHLDSASLEKLGIGLPEIGSKVYIEAVAEVKSVSASESQDGGSNKCCDLQVVQMDVEMGEGESDAAEELYGDK